MLAVSIDGYLVAPEHAAISVFDRGFLYGDGVFEVFRTWDEEAVDAAAHVERLVASAIVLSIKAPPKDRILHAVELTLANSGPGEHRIRIVLTRGPGALAAPITSLGPGRLIVIVEPLPVQPAELSLAVVDLPLARRSGAGHKTLAYLEHILARELAVAAGADEAVRLGPDGNVVECATANVFAVIGGVVMTPPVDVGILPGVTRAHVLDACALAEVAAEQRALTVDELRAADEVFITSAVRGVVPVTKLDGAPRAAGPITARVIDAYLAGIRKQTVA